MADIKQYVNLDPDKPDHLNGLDKARAGRHVTFEAKIEPVAEGIAVVFQITFGATNLVDANRVIKRAATTDKDGKAKLEYELSAHGGDEFEVKAFVKENEPAVLSDKYIVWRRFYCQIARLDAVAKGAGRGGGTLPAVADVDIAPIKTEYESKGHNVEIVVDGGVKVITRTGTNFQPVSAAMKRCARDGYVATREPVTARFIHVHAIRTPKTNAVLATGLERNQKKSFALAHALWTDESMALDADWLIAAEWKWVDDDTFTRIPPAAIKRVNDKKVDVDLGSLAIAERDGFPDAKVEVKLSYRYLGSSNNGWALNNAIWLAERNTAGIRNDADKLQTLAHEVGHFLEMVPLSQGTFYTGHGHTGKHCSTGLSDSDKGLSDPDGGAAKSYAGLQGTCIMFGENSRSRKSTYCADCTPSVRKSAVRREGMPGDW
jgi:hypothetical protein